MCKKLFFRSVFVSALLALFFATGAAYAYTLEDVQAAGNDAARLKVIIEDEATQAGIRGTAAAALPPEAAIPYLDAPFLSLDPIQDTLRTNVFKANLLPDSQYGKTALVRSLAASQASGTVMQRALVQKLAGEGKFDEALGEARRLYGITSFNGEELSQTVNVIAGLYKAKAMKDGKSFKEAVASMNDYLEAVRSGKAGQHPFASIPVPASPANVAAYEKDATPAVAIWVLLYGGKWQEAEARADAFLAIADGGTLPLAIDFKARVLNAKAGDPNAANDFVKSLE